MNIKHILILGGYGSTGLPIAQYLLSQTNVCITLAGRNLEKANRAAVKLNAEFGGNRVDGMCADASDAQSLRRAFQGMDIVVVASSTSEYVEQVAGVALEAGIDYLDVQYSTKKIQVLQSMAGEIERANLCFITDGGFHPGLPAAMVRYAAGQFDSLASAKVGSVIQIDWSTLDLSPSTLEEFVREFIGYQAMHFKDGRWQNMSALAMMSPSYMDFGGEFGRQYCMPMFLEEMRSIPEQYPSLRETGFLVGGLNWFVDWFIFPIVMVGLKLFPKTGPRPLSRLLYWALAKFSRPPYRTILKLEASGTTGNRPKSMEMQISHANGYVLTAVPVVACLMQYLDGVRKSGLWYQAQIVEPKRFFNDIEKMGVEVCIRMTDVQESK